MPVQSRMTPPQRVFLAAGLAVFVLAYGYLLATGNTAISVSRDPGAAKASLWSAILPPLAAIVLTWAVSPRARVPLPLAGLPPGRVAREAWALVGAAVVMALAAPFAQGGLYPLAKLLLLLIVPLVAFRLTRGTGEKARAIPAPVTWLAPLPAVAAWFLLSQVGPLAIPLTRQLPDPVTLAVGSLLTFLTASLLEEVFYRAWLQTRLEVRYGRWPAIVAQALLFAAMHSGRVTSDGILLGLATIVAFQGVFGLMLGHLWARYRNFWAIVFVHTVTNLVYVPMLLGRA
ncbi:hypothetical protein GCM10010106_49850 [Thermopolyspora flexuosa]|jgi:membrane protease YdiL (CAAX protease family)|uniref:CAAX prenyl protease-like protein n=1 Tax=Thermopolyspora flexuosa TaxID=103836 RepID=A0A543IQE0_9ACTN|nr:CPBP family intramembrane glutamic endopeptidase [Thermopolyspora flexuosa]TQM72788.1 CAAX prenyl protease-like protein [Thermopolyspora flexuosa]GGM95099.1 hypothetical protein GCM10010106_49850 [Thermopolyspora flexuosa]